jgi:hypothetical protein
MHGDPWKRLGWWWNQSWGTMTRRDVWLEQNILTRQFRLRWRLGHESEKRYASPNPLIVIDFLKQLIGEKKTGWQERVYLDENGTLWDHTHPTDAEKAIAGYLIPAEPVQEPLDDRY